MFSPRFHLVLDPRDSSNSLCCPWYAPPLTLMPVGVIVKISHTDHDHLGTSTGHTGKEQVVISRQGEELKSRRGLLLGDGCEMKARGPPLWTTQGPISVAGTRAVTAHRYHSAHRT